jgi:transposase, IS30 family
MANEQQLPARPSERLGHPSRPPSPTPPSDLPGIHPPRADSSPKCTGVGICSGGVEKALQKRSDGFRPREPKDERHSAVHYQHLSGTERELLGQLAAAGHTYADMGRMLGRHRSTLSRELRRNALDLKPGQGRLYLASVAQAQSQQRRAQAPRVLKLDHEPLRQQVQKRLRAYHSPEQIAGALALEYPQDPQMHLSPESLYQYLYQDYRQGGSLYRQLRQHRPKRRPRCSKRRRRLENRRSIHQRPAAANDRSEVGHWESDSVVGHGARLITHVERFSGYLLTRKVPDGTAGQMNRATVRAFQPLPAELCKSLTSDNGSEFAGHEALTSRTGMPVYFADPHSPWQRGLNENTNGLLRQFFPKGSDFTGISRQRLAWVERLVNNRPRKRLGYQTPAAVLLKLRSDLSPRALQT